MKSLQKGDEYICKERKKKRPAFKIQTSSKKKGRGKEFEENYCEKRKGGAQKGDAILP